MPNLLIPGIPFFDGESPSNPSFSADRFVNDQTIVQFLIKPDLYEQAMSVFSTLSKTDGPISSTVEFGGDFHPDLKAKEITVNANGSLTVYGETDGDKTCVLFEQGISLIDHALKSAATDYKSLEMVLVYKDVGELSDMKEIIENDDSSFEDSLKIENVYWKTDTNLLIPKPPAEIKYFLSMDGEVGYISAEGSVLDEQGYEDYLNCGP